MLLREYHYQRLDNEQKDAYMTVKSALLVHKKKITINFIPNIHQAISALKHDCSAEFYYVNWACIENRIFFMPVKRKIVLYPLYVFSIEETAKYNRQIQKLVKTFARYKDSGLLCRKVHDWLSVNVRYDRDEIDKHCYRRNNHNIIGPLIERLAVCEGISLAYQYILNLLGIDCMTVIGRTLKDEGRYCKEYHAWNVISLNNQNYHVDVTWDYPLEINGKKYPTYAYYCVPTRLFKDHICGLNLKCESLEENLFYKTNRLFSCAKQLKAFVSQYNPYNCCMIYVSNLTHHEIDQIVKRYGAYNYRVVQTTQWQQSGMWILFKK